MTGDTVKRYRLTTALLDHVVNLLFILLRRYQRNVFDELILLSDDVFLQ